VRVSASLFKRIALSYLRSICFWLAIGAVIAFQQNYFERELGYHTHFLQLVFIVLIRFIDFALLTPPLFFLVLRFPVNRYKPILGLVAYALGAIPFVIFYMLIRLIPVPIWDTHLQRFVPSAFSLHNMAGIVYGTIGDQIAVYITIVIAAHAYKYFEQGRHEELERSELQQALTASELQTLKSQLRPHFLFNTLHGILTLIDSDRALAKAMVVKLSSLLRATLQDRSSDMTTLQDEIRFVESYLDLEKMRLGTRLEVRWQIDPDTLQLLVPQLVLQPLVENALLHGIACSREGGWLELASRRENGTIELQIRNSVGGKGQGGMGLGLQNTRARLKYLYSDEAMFSFSVADTHIATAILVFPAFESREHAPMVASKVASSQ
jgi:two-component system, LytTR family, sensor kinase